MKSRYKTPIKYCIKKIKRNFDLQKRVNLRRTRLIIYIMRQKPTAEGS